MPYLGRGPAKSGAFRILDDVSGSFNGSTTSFALTVASAALTVGLPETLTIAVDGVIQEPGSAFTISGSNIVFTAAPQSEATFWGVELGDVGGLADRATTQSASDNSTKVATTAYVDAQVATEDTITELNDTTITSIASGEVLKWNGSAWINNTLAELGVLTVSNPTFTGTLTVGSAALVESELEMLDGITAGTAAASKAIVLDSNKDIGTIRNLTIDGTFSDGNYTFDTSGNVSGLGTIGSGAITSTGVVTATGFTIGSAAITEAELEILDGASVTTAELNILDGVTSTAAELNLLDGVSGLVQADLTKLAAVDSTAVELNLLDALDRGSILYGNASGVTTVLGQGGADTVLTSDGTDISWAAVGGAAEISCSIYIYSSANISSGTDTMVAWTHVIRDSYTDGTYTDGMHHTSVTGPYGANTRVYAPVAGWYSMGASISWAGTANTGIRRIQLIKSGDTTYPIATERFNPESNSDPRHHISIVYYLTAGQYIETRVHQSSGVTLAMNGRLTQFWMAKVN